MSVKRHYWHRASPWDVQLGYAPKSAAGSAMSAAVLVNGIVRRFSVLARTRGAHRAGRVAGIFHYKKMAPSCCHESAPVFR